MYTYTIQRQIPPDNESPTGWVEVYLYRFTSRRQGDLALELLQTYRSARPDNTYRLVRSYTVNEVMVEPPGTDRALGESWVPLEPSV